jgi:hypothetical protein
MAEGESCTSPVSSEAVIDLSLSEDREVIDLTI